MLRKFKNNIQNVDWEKERRLYWILKTMNGNFETGCVWLIKWTSDCCCEHGNERLGFQELQSISWLADKMPDFGAGVRLMEFFLAASHLRYFAL